MKVLLIGERYSSNLGDPIICETVESQLLSKFSQAEIVFTDISGRDGYNDTSTNKKHLLIKGRFSSFKKKVSIMLTKLGIDTEYIKFKRANINNIKHIEKVCDSEFDIAIFAGGQMFKDTFVFPIAEYVKCLSKKNIPIVFNACGAGEILSPKMRNVLSEALSNPNVIAISSRDDIDKINELYLNNSSKKTVKTYDPGLWVDEVYNIRKKNSDIVGLGVMYAHNMKFKDMLGFWKGIIDELNNRKVKWKFFCNGVEKDYELAQYILNSLGYSEEEKKKLLIPRPKRPKEFVEIISSFKSIISFRLHSHIVAYSLDIPGVSIVWDEKIRFFYRGIGLENRCKNLKDNCLDIIKELENAEIEGYDNKLRTQQKEHCNELLIKMASGEDIQ